MRFLPQLQNEKHVSNSGQESGTVQHTCGARRLRSECMRLRSYCNRAVRSAHSRPIRCPDWPPMYTCSRRQIGTKPSDVASAPHSHNGRMARNVRTFASVVRGSRTILYDSLVGTVKESYLLQRSVALLVSGSGTHSHWPVSRNRSSPQIMTPWC